MRIRSTGVPALALATGMAAVLLGVSALSARAGEGARAAPDAAVYLLYCSGCHGSGARGGPAAESEVAGPDLTRLAARSPHPDALLPVHPYVEFVTSPRRPGAQRICGERVFARLPPSRFREQVERWVVREALDYVATLQRREEGPSRAAP
jgi:hypothetical protein